MHEQFYIDPTGSTSLNVDSPRDGTTLFVGDTIELSATPAGNTGAVLAVRFLANGVTVGNGIRQANGKWTASWISAGSGQFLVEAHAFGTADAVLAQSAPAVVILVAKPSAILGAVGGVRTGPAGLAQLIGWACEDGKAQALSYKLYANARAAQEGLLLAEGLANVATELGNADVQARCHAPGAGHDFVIDLSSFIGAHAGAALFVEVMPVGGGQGTLLACEATSCAMPSALRIELTSPANGQRMGASDTLMLSAQIDNVAGPYDEVAFGINGAWIAATAEGANGAFIASKAGLLPSMVPYHVQARVRKGPVTLFTTPRQLFVDAPNGTGISVDALPAGVSTYVGTAVDLTVTATGDTASIVHAGREERRTPSDLDTLRWQWPSVARCRRVPLRLHARSCKSFQLSSRRMETLRRRSTQ